MGMKHNFMGGSQLSMYQYRCCDAHTFIIPQSRNRVVKSIEGVILNPVVEGWLFVFVFVFVCWGVGQYCHLHLYILVLVIIGKIIRK